jgi:cell division transport system permease protein
MKTWLRHHADSFRATVARLARQPVATLLNVASIGIALALPLGAYVLLENARKLAHNLAGDPQLSVFLAQDATKADAERIEAAMKATATVRKLRFVPRDEALAELKRTEGLADIVSALKSNPLPDAYVAELVPGDAPAAEALAARVRELPKVAQVQLDAAWVRRLDALLGLGRTAVAVLATLLSIGLVAVTFNTVRLQILTQAAEIEVCRLIGATDGYIRRPFYYLGACLGGLGGLVAILAVATAVHFLNADVATVASTYGSSFRLTLPGIGDVLSTVGFAAALGLTGAYLSVGRHLRPL